MTHAQTWASYSALYRFGRLSTAVQKWTAPQHHKVSDQSWGDTAPFSHSLGGTCLCCPTASHASENDTCWPTVRMDKRHLTDKPITNVCHDNLTSAIVEAQTYTNTQFTILSRTTFGKSSESVQCAITGPCLRMRQRPSA